MPRQRFVNSQSDPDPTTYSFELDAYSASHDIHSAVASQTLPACADQPTIISAVGDGDGGQITGDVTITFTTSSSDYANEYSRYITYLILNRDDDPYHLFYQSTVSNCDFGNGQGGAIPAYDVTRTDMTNGVGTYVADFPVFASNQNVTFQILLVPYCYADAISPSVPVGAAVGDSSGWWDYPIPTPPVLSASLDGGGNLDIGYTTLDSTSSDHLADQTFNPEFYAVVNGTAVPLTDVTDYGVAGNDAPWAGVISVPADSPYSGDEIFAVYGPDHLVDPFRDGNPYWSGYSNFVSNDGASSDGGVSAPSNVTATLTDLGDQFIHWKNLAAGATGVALEVLASNGTWLTVGSVAANVMSFNLTNAAIAAAFAGTGLTPSATAPAATQPTTGPATGPTRVPSTRAVATTGPTTAASMPATTQAGNQKLTQRFGTVPYTQVELDAFAVGVNAILNETPIGRETIKTLNDKNLGVRVFLADKVAYWDRERTATTQPWPADYKERFLGGEEDHNTTQVYVADNEDPYLVAEELVHETAHARQKEIDEPEAYTTEAQWNIQMIEAGETTFDEVMDYSPMGGGGADDAHKPFIKASGDGYAVDEDAIKGYIGVSNNYREMPEGLYEVKQFKNPVTGKDRDYDFGNWILEFSANWST